MKEKKSTKKSNFSLISPVMCLPIHIEEVSETVEYAVKNKKTKASKKSKGS